MADDTPEGQEPAEPKLSAAELAKELAAVRKEAAERRVKLREYEEAEAKRAEELKSREEAEALKRGEFEKIDAERKAELEAMKRSIAQKESAMKKRLVDEALRARLADAVDPDVLKLIDRKGISIDDETLEISGLDEVVTSFREAKPHFFGAAPAPPPAGTNITGTGPGRSPAPVKGIDFSDTSKPLAQLEAEFKAKAAS